MGVPSAAASDRTSVGLLNISNRACRRSLAGVGCKASRVETEPLPGSLNHSLGHRNLCLADYRRRFDFNDDRVVEVDQIVRLVGEVGEPTIGARSAGRRIDR